MNELPFGSVEVGKTVFRSPIGLAAGVMKTFEYGAPFLKTEIGFATFGSLKYDPWPGNTGDTYYNIPGVLSVNALGLPGAGIENSKFDIRRLSEAYTDAGKVLIFSSAGDTPENHVLICQQIKHDVRVLEINFGCPNVWSKGAQHPIQSYSPDFVKRTLELVKIEFGKDHTILAKFSPLLFKENRTYEQVLNDIKEKALDRNYLIHVDNPGFQRSLEISEEIVQIVVNSGVVDGVVLINTLGNVEVRDGNTNASLLNYNDGKTIGGLAGPIIKDLAIENIRSWRNRLPNSIKIFGCGGLYTGTDMKEFLDAGADVVELNSGLFPHKLEKFSEILAGCYAEKES